MRENREREREQRARDRGNRARECVCRGRGGEREGVGGAGGGRTEGHKEVAVEALRVDTGHYICTEQFTYVQI